MIMCVLLCYPISIHMSQLLSTGRPISSFTLLWAKVGPKLGFYVPFNSQGHIGTGPQNCHLWDSNPQR